MKVRLLDEAKAEIREAALWYEERQEGLGEDFLAAIANAMEILESKPNQFPELETYHGRRQIKRCLLTRFPYLLVFENLSEEILVLAAAHGSQKPNCWKNRGP